MPHAPAPQVKITAIKTYAFKQATFVKIETDAGISGWGEADHDWTGLVAQVVEQICAPIYIGQNPFNSDLLWREAFFRGEDAGSTGLLPGALAGVDNAVWDLKGKLLDVPVYQLLGGAHRTRLRVYGSFGRGGKMRGPTDMAKTAEDFVAQGYKTIKARMQIRQLNVDPDPDETYAIVKAIRQAVGDDIELFVDFNNGYTPAKALAMGLRLYEHFNIAAVEEPVSQFNYAGLRQVVEGLPIPVMAGEHEFNKWQMRDLITIGGVDVVNLDLIKCGGLTECMKVAALAECFDRPVMAHNARPTLACATTLHLLAAIPNAARVQEHGGYRPELGLYGLFRQNVQFQDGYLYLPQSPGLGLDVDEDRMDAEKLNR